ncbi:sigma-70 family RNA polymerase sigma factor [Streptomyces sp. NPDC056938]|uniref:sigma-70 family RNA polymerase sigma factor n=1 Tax=unclassified Streptomyces TaxID=2593676 RepID=UPI0036314A2E
MPGTITKREAEQLTSRGNGPNGRKLRQGEDIPMTPEQSERLGVLFERYSSALVSYARRRLTGYGFSFAAAETLAEDIAQEAWIEVSRTGAKDLLRPEPLSNNETRAILYARVKTQIGKHFRRSSSYERPVDFGDPITCHVLCPLVDEQCPLAEPSESLLRLVADLPEREREALLLNLDGCPNSVVGERLGCSMTTGRRLVDTAVLRLQLCCKEVAREPVAVESLPAWQREALATLDDKQRDALLRIDDFPRQVLLLHLSSGLDANGIAARLNIERMAIRAAYGCVTSLKKPEKAAARGIFREKGGAARDLAKTLRSEVETLKPGEKAPAERALSTRFHCSARTARAALKELCAEGLLVSRGSQGLFRATAARDLAAAA